MVRKPPLGTTYFCVSNFKGSLETDCASFVWVFQDEFLQDNAGTYKKSKSNYKGAKLFPNGRQYLYLERQHPPFSSRIIFTKYFY